MLTVFNCASTCVSSIDLILISSLPIGFTWLLVLSKKRYPKAVAIPIPQSFVALPPIPKMMCFAPLLIASRINCPVPKVVVFIQFCSFGFKSFKPDASAISIKAVLDSSAYR